MSSALKIVDGILNQAPDRLKSHKNRMLLVSISGFLEVCKQEQIYPKTKYIRAAIASHSEDSFLL